MIQAMKILTGDQIREADRVTMLREGIESIELMERASELIAQWVCNNVDMSSPLSFVIGRGGNGGDGLAVARILYNAGYSCSVYMAYDKQHLSEECRFNFGRLPRGLKPQNIDKLSCAESGTVIDALLGSGLRNKADDFSAGIIHSINALRTRVISIDMPSGLPSEGAGRGVVAVKADVTLAIGFPKLSLLMPESGEAAGKIEVLDIGLDKEFIAAADSDYEYVDGDFIRGLLLPRAKFANKGTYGHTLLVCGSDGMVGAALLATGAALRSGCGLVSVCLPQEAAMTVHITHPSAMVAGYPERFFTSLPEGMDRYDVIGVGPGLGRHRATAGALKELLRSDKRLVIDADALNLVAEHKVLYNDLPRGALLTPHPGELRRLVGEWSDDTEKMALVSAFARDTGCYVLVKGAHSMVCTPGGKIYFNSSGCAGMAKGGSGDVLTGYLAGLIARGYGVGEAAVAGMYIHGAAGEKAAEFHGEEGMNSSDIIDFLGEAVAGLN